MVMTGQAKIASARQAAIVTRSEKMSNALRARGGSSEITTSMRIWRPAQPTGPAPEEDAADHQEQHRFLSPRQRHGKKIAADDVGEVDGDAAGEHRAGRKS